MTCVKWCNVWSSWFTLRCGIRQGGVFLPCLFAIYVDDLVNQVKLCGFGCYIRCTCISILLYADNILLLVPSISALQSLCEKELEWLDMSINVKKSQLASTLAHDAMWMWVYYYTKCWKNIMGWQSKIPWCILPHLISSAVHCLMPRNHFIVHSIVFGKVGRVASENVIVELLKMKCLPCLYYGLEACPLIQSQLRSLEFAVNGAFRKKYFP